MFQDLLGQALVEIARGHEEELCRVTEALRTENANLTSQLTRLQMQLSFASQLPSADAPPKPPPLDMPNAAPPLPPPELSSLPGTVDHGDKGELEAVPGTVDHGDELAGAQSQEAPGLPMARLFSCEPDVTEQLQECPSQKSELPVNSPSQRSQLPAHMSQSQSVLRLTPLALTSENSFTLEAVPPSNHTVQLHPPWRQACVSSKRASSTRGSQSPGLHKLMFTPVHVVERVADGSCCWNCLNSLVMDPGSNKRRAFEVFGLLLIFYDLVWWPAQIFGYTSVPFTDVILWLSSAFWKCDLLMSFFVGFTIHDQGLIEMRVSKVARHYAMTWLPIELSLVLLDSTLNALILLSDHKVADLGGDTFLAKVPYLRMIRLLRLIKATNIISDLSDRIQSETTRILVRVLKLLFFIMLINHLVACCWYAVGISDLEREDTWVKANDLNGKGKVYAYTTALHWSMTQFTPASMEVVPVNELERSFTICVIVSAMVIFSSFISTITNAMNQLKNLNSERNAELVKLRRFFSERRVSASLVARISSCIHQSTKLTSSRVHSEDISILELLPVSLKCDLAEEVFAPTLCAHPFFLTWGGYYPRECKRLCLAARSLSLNAQDELFNTGQASGSMYFLTSGAMVFTRDDRELAELPAFVSPGQWLAEPSLWIQWKHVGHVSSTENCELVSLHCEPAIKVLAQNTSTISGARRYARTFAAYFDRQPDRLSDVWADMDVIEAFVSEAFIRHEKELLRQVLVSTVMKDLVRPGPLSRMSSRLSSNSMDAFPDEQTNLTALEERVRKYSADGQKRKEALGLRGSDSEGSCDGSVNPPVFRDPQSTPSIGRGTFGLNGLNVVPGITSAFRVLTRKT
ncbi:unnamed protein product [Polarella glacialis]|uniref:Ion transport domain-containing protein n=1 Tax=Polarella glacialis TaxID=89957 RepID=A0A813D3F6_POLGL|nr:unnamed protein product [Polarella glacialis]